MKTAVLPILFLQVNFFFSGTLSRVVKEGSNIINVTARKDGREWDQSLRFVSDTNEQTRKSNWHDGKHGYHQKSHLEARGPNEFVEDHAQDRNALNNNFINNYTSISISNLYLGENILPIKKLNRIDNLPSSGLELKKSFNVTDIYTKEGDVLRKGQGIKRNDSNKAQHVMPRKKIPHKNRPHKRYKRSSSTSKFTGLVVGASESRQLKESVLQRMTQIEDSIWKQQFQVTRLYDDRGPASIMGAFPSSVHYNFHGEDQEARRREASSVSDINAPTLLLVLQCISESTIYGSAKNPTTSSMTTALEALQEFHVQGRPSRSALLTFWPEYFQAEAGWRGNPVNILKNPNSRVSLFEQLTRLKDACPCSTSKQAFNEINSSPVCKQYFSESLHSRYRAVSLPPDFASSFSNLALGALFNARRSYNGVDDKVFSAELELWSDLNGNTDSLIRTLKRMVVVFPAPNATSHIGPLLDAEIAGFRGPQNQAGSTNNSNVTVTATAAASVDMQANISHANNTKTDRNAGDQKTSIATNQAKQGNNTNNRNSHPSLLTRLRERNRGENKTETNANTTTSNLNKTESSHSGKNVNITTQAADLQHSRRKRQAVEVREPSPDLPTTLSPSATILMETATQTQSVTPTLSSTISISTYLSTEALTQPLTNVISTPLTNLATSFVTATTLSEMSTTSSRISPTPSVTADTAIDTFAATPTPSSSVITLSTPTVDSSTIVPSTPSTQTLTQSHGENVSQSTTATSTNAGESITGLTSAQPTTNNPTAVTTTALPAESTAKVTAESTATPRPTIKPTVFSSTQAPSTTNEPPPKHVNQILDSISYFNLVPYLDDVIPTATEDVILIPTWVSEACLLIETDEENHELTSTPCNYHVDGDLWHNGRRADSYNSVDLHTTAITLHALVVGSMTGLVEIKSDVLLQAIMRSSLRVLVWYMNHPSELQRSIHLSTFPSRFQFYWMVSKVAFQLNSKQARNSDIFHFALSTIEEFQKAVRDKMTYSILESIQDGGLGSDGKTRVFVDDFVGVADIDQNGHQKVSGDDRLFTSAMAVNALVSVWTTHKDNGLLSFIEETQDPVRIAVNSLVNYITGKVIDEDVSHTSPFASQLSKNCASLPASFPATIVSTKKGEKVNPSSLSIHLRFGVEGYVPLAKLQSSSVVPSSVNRDQAASLTAPTSIFPFWSSGAYTKAACLLAVSLAANLDIVED